ncbi:MAG: hypothetical protein QM765_47730 [Myxococcales bacterium]
MLALAAVLTAWSAFQSAKWNGQQATAFSEAAAARTQAARAADRADQLRSLDANVFIAWVQAVATDIGPEELMARGYAPKPGTVSTFLFRRLRKDFRPAMEAWLASRPFQSEEAPATPFEMPQYRLPQDEQAAQEAAKAEERDAEARAHNLRSDHYVALTVVFALVFFFAGVGTKLQSRRAQRLMLGLGLVLFLGACAILITFPVALR